MKQKLLKILVFIASILIIISIILGALVYFKYKNMEKENASARLVSSAMTPDDNIHLGVPVVISYVVISHDKYLTNM